MTDDPKDKRRVTSIGQKSLDKESAGMLYSGASVSQLGVLFQMDNRTITKKIQGIEPIGTRGGYPIYAIRDAAQYLVKPLGDIEETIKKMDPDELPPHLNQRFWAGQRERNRFYEEQGDLWNTGEVLEHFSSVFKTLRMNLELLQDAVAEQTTFSPQQREILAGLIDSALEKCRVSLTEQFKTEEGQSIERGASAGDTDDASPDYDDDPFFSVPDSVSDEETL